MYIPCTVYCVPCYADNSISCKKYVKYAQRCRGTARVRELSVCVCVCMHYCYMYLRSLYKPTPLTTDNFRQLPCPSTGKWKGAVGAVARQTATVCAYSTAAAAASTQLAVHKHTHTHKCKRNRILATPQRTAQRCHPTTSFAMQTQRVRVK